MRKLSVLFLFSFLFQAYFAQASEEPQKWVQGEMGLIDFQSSSDHLNRQVLYYVPSSIELRKNLKQKALFFLHGGGDSTRTPEGAFRSANNMIWGFKNYADQQNVILVFPTTTIGWNAETSPFLRELLQYVKTKVNLDEDKLVLAGHSMGAMGITREYPYLTDQFSGFLAMAGGTQQAMHDENLVLPYLNGTPYVHLNGVRDTSFPTWRSVMEQFKERVSEVEMSYGIKSKFNLVFHPEGHNIYFPFAEIYLDDLYRQPSNRYPVFFQAPIQIYKENIRSKIDRAFWVKFSHFKNEPIEGRSATSWVHASAKNQKIKLSLIGDELGPSELELSLSQKFIDLRKPIAVYFEGKLIYSSLVPNPEQRSTATLRLKI